jgi:two-component system response regulator HydG
VGSSKAVKVDLRVIAATNRDLETEVASGRFRTDLYYRLNVIPLNLPALRERADDIPLLADHFMKLYCPDYPGNLGTAVDEAALRALQTYDWPGNVRELENVIERASIIREGERIMVRDLPETVRTPSGEVAASNLVGGQVSLEDLEKAHILQVLESVGGHKKQAAEILKINPSTLYRKLLRYGMEEPGEEMRESLAVDEESLAEECNSQLVGPDGEAIPEDEA